MENKEQTHSETPVKRVQVSASVDPEVAEALDAIFYDARGGYSRRSDVVRDAIHTFVKSHGKM